jgi:hypothetical protein
MTDDLMASTRFAPAPEPSQRHCRSGTYHRDIVEHRMSLKIEIVVVALARVMRMR